MSSPASPQGQGSSTRPYLIRALHEWCTDNGFTPYIAVHVDGGVQVPKEYVKNNEIVLNVSIDATSSLSLGNDAISFKARFGGVAREIMVPVDHVVAIYARENGQGMAFPMPSETAEAQPPDAAAGAPQRGLRLAADADDPQAVSLSPVTAAQAPPDDPSPEPPPAPRPSLKRIK